MRESSIRCICPYHSILRALINRTMSWCSRMPFISALYLILHSLFIFTPPYIFRIILLSNLLNLSLSASVSVHQGKYIPCCNCQFIFIRSYPFSVNHVHEFSACSLPVRQSDPRLIIWLRSSMNRSSFYVVGKLTQGTTLLLYPGLGLA
uniref:Uncharacterized protein n=1 Tax=Cacopsylla melanoneura TaxID=428564 RepID=A0A8D8M9I4_9HEMI